MSKKALKYIGSFVCIVLVLAEILPVYLITMALVTGQVGDDGTYFAGKLLAHIFIAILFGFIAVKLIRSARNESKKIETSV